MPAVLAQWLRDKGHVAEHVRELGLNRAKDRAIWHYAVSNSAIIVTKGEDFVKIRTAIETGPQVIWLRVGNATNDALFAWFEPRYPRMVVAILAAGAVIELM